MTSQSIRDAVERLLTAEAYYLDRREWDSWIALHEPDVEFWVPAYDDFGELVADPKTGVSHIFYDSRARLEERIFRLRSRKSAASVPLARTAHFFQFLSVVEENGGLTVHTNWRVDCYRMNESTSNFGWAIYNLQGDLDNLRIRRKKIILLNDIVDSVLDIYMI